MRDEPQFLSCLHAATTHRLAAVACTCSSHQAACRSLLQLDSPVEVALLCWRLLAWQRSPWNCCDCRAGGPSFWSSSHASLALSATHLPACTSSSKSQLLGSCLRALLLGQAVSLQ